jgi:hypothetical protein
MRPPRPTGFLLLSFETTESALSSHWRMNGKRNETELCGEQAPWAQHVVERKIVTASFAPTTGQGHWSAGTVTVGEQESMQVKFAWAKTSTGLFNEKDEL